MNKRAIFYLCSLLLLVMGCAMATAVPVAWLMKDSMYVTLRFFLLSLAVCSLSSVVFIKTRRRKNEPESKPVPEKVSFPCFFHGWGLL